MTTKKTATVKPPAQAVAQDAHWSASLERLRNRQRPTATLTICDDQDIKDRLAYARQVERRAQAHAEDNPGAEATELLEQAKAGAEKAQEAYDAEAIVLRFQALTRTDFDALKEDHKPTEEQADEGELVNVETLGPELIAASSLDGITVDDAQRFLNEWAAAEGAQLFHAAWDVQAHSRMDLGKG